MARIRAGMLALLVLAGLLVVMPAGVGNAASPKGGNDAASHWTAARRKAAIPRDLVLDDRGLAYVQRPDGTLVPHGHATPQLHGTARATKPTAGKPGGGDSTGPAVTNRDPGVGATIGASYKFSATVTDPSGIRSVTFVLVYPNNSTQSFAASGSGSTYSTTLQGFTDGAWKWRVVAKDNAGRTGNTTTSTTTGFTVKTSGGGGGGNVANAAWPGTGTVQTAAGRIYFEMPTNTAQTNWAGYVCSGTVAQDSASSRSVIITAGHCVYDDVHKVFARNVLFIPNQDGTTGTATDLNCDNDPMGCWSPSFGVVDRNWTTRTFPDNIPWDYAYYVVPDSGAHSGHAASSSSLAAAAGALPVQFSPNPTSGTVTRALGYSYSEDPNFMYCSQPVAVDSGTQDWWLGQCGLSGGASGGPWEQGANPGEGPIMSVNSWGYTNQPGMGGPRLAGTSASCVFGLAQTGAAAGTSRGAVADCP